MWREIASVHPLTVHLVEPNLVNSGQLLDSASASFPNLGTRGAKKKGTLIFRVTLQNAKYENKAVEVRKSHQAIGVEVSGWIS